MNKHAWAEKLFDSNLLGPDELYFAFILCQYTDYNGENCYRTLEFLSKRSMRCENTTRKALNNLVRLGFVKQDLASLRHDIPKTRGYVWSLVQNPGTNKDATIAPSSAEPSQREPSQREPSRREGSAHAPSDSSSQSNKNNKLNNKHQVNPHAVKVSTVPYSDTTKEGDRGRFSASSRVCEPAREELTYSAPPSAHFEPSSADERRVEPAPIDRAEVAAIKQAIEDALPTLDMSGVRGLYGLAQQILAARSGLDDAKLYVEQRGLEWTQRLLEGQRYPAYAIVRLIAKDAPSWRPPSSRALPQSPAAPPQATPLAQLPDWWTSLLNGLYEALKGHRRHDTTQSRTYAKQLAGLLHHLSRPLHVCCQDGELTILIDDTGPDPDTFDIATSYIPYLLQKSDHIELTATRIQRANAALQRAS